MKLFTCVLWCLLALVLVRCTNGGGADAPAQSTGADGTEQTEKTSSGKEILENLRANALAEDDIEGRLRASLAILQEVYQQSEPHMETLQDVRLEATADCRLTIYNAAGGDRKTVVDLSRLDLQAMSLISDNAPGEFPGMRIATQAGKPLVEEYAGDKLVTRNNEWVIYLADRPAIERIAPVVVQMIRLCQGNLE